MAEIRVENVHKSFGDFVAVRGSTFTVADGTFFVILGPSGCGKTTTLRMIAGLELPSAGRIVLGGEDVTMRRASARDIAFVFQLFALYPHMNVRRNIAYPLKNQGMARDAIRRKVGETARSLRIEHLLDRSVHGLSSGDRQRVALGRAIVREPKAFLMDEPLGALDTEMRHVMCAELRAVHDRLRATTVYVTHDQSEAMAMADAIMIMNQGDIEQLGTPQDIYDRPASLFVADFVGSPPMNLIDVHGALRAGDRAIALGEGRQEVPEIREDRPAADHVLGVRPEHVRLDDAGAVRGEVYGLEYLGTTQIATVKLDAGRIRARLPSSMRLQVGERVALSFRPEKLSLFDRASGRAIRTALHDRAAAAPKRRAAETAHG
jgi:multiple sugar transport system ATP-binding protein